MIRPYRTLAFLAALAAGPADAAEGLDLPRLVPEAGAFAAPAPPRAKAAPPTEARARPCPEQGPGFVRMPGAATCVRLSGRAAGGVAARTGGAGTAVRPEAEGRFAIDARTDTDLGPVRTYVRVGTGRR